MPPGAVERFYSNGAYLALQAHLTQASNRVPFALLDALLLAVLAGWIGAIAIDLRRCGALRVLGRLVARTVVLVAVMYVAFLSLWGLNYRRVPLSEKLQFDGADVSPAAARVLAATAIERVNALYDRGHGAARPAADDDGTNPPLTEAFARVQHDLGASRPAWPGRPKHTLLDVYFRRAAVDGMTDPYFLEPLLNSELLPFERPFVVAHEWSHLAGYADEGEANFVGWLTCLRGGEGDQYSGWLFLSGALLSAVSPAERAPLIARLGPGPRADRRAIGDRIRRHLSPRISTIGWTVYDRYLKANRVEAGAASYNGVVRLALGARFGPNWTPLRRSP